MSAASPLGCVLEMVEHFAGFAHKENSLVLTIGILLDVDRSWVTITEIYFPAHRFGNSSGKRDTAARGFDTVFLGAEALGGR